MPKTMVLLEAGTGSGATTATTTAAAEASSSSIVSSLFLPLHQFLSCQQQQQKTDITTTSTDTDDIIDTSTNNNNMLGGEDGKCSSSSDSEEGQRRRRRRQPASFDCNEIILGNLVGQGAFCEVHDLYDIKLNDNNNSNSKEDHSNNNNDTESATEAVADDEHYYEEQEEEERKRICNTCRHNNDDDEVLRGGNNCRSRRRCYRYVVKHLKPNLVSERSAKVYKHAHDDCLREFDILYRLSSSHTNIIQLQGYNGKYVDGYSNNNKNNNNDDSGSSSSSSSSSRYNYYRPEHFFIILEKLQETLTQRIVRWIGLQIASNNSSSSSSSSKLSGVNGSSDYNYDESSYRQLPPFYVEKLRYARDIASAVTHIHNHRMVFRDLKPDNCGITLDGTIKLFDFGLCRELPEIATNTTTTTQCCTQQQQQNTNNCDCSTSATSSSTTSSSSSSFTSFLLLSNRSSTSITSTSTITSTKSSSSNYDSCESSDARTRRRRRSRKEKEEELFRMSTVGTRRYMSPEVISGYPYNQKTDVYSWSMVFYEMLCLQKPFAKYSRSMHKILVCDNHGRPRLPPTTTTGTISSKYKIMNIKASRSRSNSNTTTTTTIPWMARDLLRRGWAQNSYDRPTMEQIHDDVCDVLRTVEQQTLPVSERSLRAVLELSELLLLT